MNRNSWYGGVSRSRARMLPLLGIQVLSEYHRLGRLPPVTAGILLTNTLIYFRPGPLDDFLPSIRAVLFNPHLILKYKDLRRFFLSAFYHLDETHLVYNMMSLLWKGNQLETSMGSTKFASMVATLVSLSQGITLILAKSLLLFFDYETTYYNQYSVGFSGVLFAMKVILNSRAEDLTIVHGVVVPSRHAAWAELILIQLFVPGSSFLGHLGGILAGLLYLRLRNFYRGSDPLATLFENVAGILSWPMKFVGNLFQTSGPRILGRGRVGGAHPGRPASSSVWRCPTCTYDNPTWVDICEMCSTERGGGRGFLSMQSAYTENITMEEIRRRRLERFDRLYS